VPGFPARSSLLTRCLTVFGTALAAVGLANAPARADVVCNTPAVAMYHVDGLSQLRRWSYGSPLDGSSSWTEQLLGSGWGALNIVSGGSGVLYTIDSSGNLHWYLDADYTGGVANWDPASGSVIGTGWGGFNAVFSGGQGVIYAIDSSGNLRWYRYTAGNGSPEWAPNSGTVIGTGWDGAAKIMAGGSGVIYTVDSSGDLLWYRHQDPMGGAATWANGGAARQIGSGWASFTRLGSMGGGVIFARDSTGQQIWYRHADPLGGSATWANGAAGISEGTGWSNAQTVTDVTGCVAS
jgi:hypothetical protein